MPALRPRITCTSCNVVRRVEGTHALCDHCASDARAFRAVVALILQKFPKMSAHTPPEIFLRLWMQFPPVQKDPEALRAAEELSRRIAGSIISEAPKPEGPEDHEKMQESRALGKVRPPR